MRYLLSEFWRFVCKAIAILWLAIATLIAIPVITLVIAIVVVFGGTLGTYIWFTVWAVDALKGDTEWRSNYNEIEQAKSIFIKVTNNGVNFPNVNASEVDT